MSCTEELKTRDVNLFETYDFMKQHALISRAPYDFNSEEPFVDMGDKMNYDDLMTGFKAGHDVSLDNFSSTAMTAFALQAIHEQGSVLDHRTSNQTDLMFNLQPLVQNLVSAEDRALTHQSLYLLQRLRMDVRAPIRPRITSNSGQKFHQLVEKVKFVETSALYKLMSMHPAQLSSIFN